MYNTITSLLISVFTMLLLTSASLKAQKISSASIEQCYQWAKEHYPISKQLDIIDRTTQYSISNASHGNLPQINLAGQATYQSAVTELPINIPNMEVPTIDKDQYKIYGEVYQPLTKFSNVNVQKKHIENNGEIEKQQIEIDLYKIKDRVNQLFFSVLLIDTKIEQFNIIQEDLDSALTKIEAAIENGTATLTDKKLLKVERISIDQQIAENRENQSAFLLMLSALTGRNITKETTFIKPTDTITLSTILRPELELFNLQMKSIDLRKKQIDDNLIPNIGLFGQAGYGRPALNFLSNEFDFYYIAGIKFNWNISSLYNNKNSKASLDLSSQKIGSLQETFLLNTTLTQTQQSAEIQKFKSLLKTDEEIINIREEVLLTAKVQLDNGLITTIDYVKILNDVSKANQAFLLHETQLLLAQYNLKNTTGN